MSKQAGEICIRCPKCGEFEVPVDWSKCARKEVQIVRCDKCGTEFAYCSAHRGAHCHIQEEAQEPRGEVAAQDILASSRYRVAF